MAVSIRMQDRSTNLLDRVQRWLRLDSRSTWTAFLGYTKLLRAQFAQHDCLTAAGALTYTSLLALVPLMTVTYIGLSLVPQYAELGTTVQDFVFRNFVPASSELVQQKLNEFADRARGLTTAGAASLLLVALLMLVSIEQRFNSIWQVVTPKWGLQRVLVYWGVLSLGPAFLLVGVWSSAYLIGLPLISEIDVLNLRSTALGYLPTLLMLAGFTALYVVVPNSTVPLRHGLLGGVLTTLVFQLAFEGFATASQYFVYDAVYGAFAALPAFLLWLYLVWVIVLSGAIFVRSLSLRSSVPLIDEPLLIRAARVLRVTAQAHRSGMAVSESELAQQVNMTAEQHQRVFAALQELKLIGNNTQRQWVLGRDLQAVSLWQLYRLLPDDLTVADLQAVTDFSRLTELLGAVARYNSGQLSVSLAEVVE